MEFFKCMVNFKTCKMFSDKECQIDMLSGINENFNKEVSEIEARDDLFMKGKKQNRMLTAVSQ